MQRVLASAAVVGLSAVGLVSLAPSVGAESTEYTENGAYEVPAGVCQVQITAFGGAGGDGIDGDGGLGGGITAVFRVTPVSTLDVFVGKQGQVHQASGGAGGSGFDPGGHADTGGGGGGGSSAVEAGTTVLVVAGGGGGGSWDLGSGSGGGEGGVGGAGGLGAANGDPGGGPNGGAGGITGDPNTEAGPGGDAAGDAGGGGGAGSAPGSGGAALSGGGGGASAADPSALEVASSGGPSVTPDGRVIIEPYPPGIGCGSVIAVKKAVTGTSDSGFAVETTCKVVDLLDPLGPGGEVVVAESLPFTPDGTPDASRAPAGWSVENGAWQFSVPPLDESAPFDTFCSAIETETGGATSVSYECAWTPGPGERPLPPNLNCEGDDSVFLNGRGDTALITVTNVFPAVVPPRFTG